MNEVMSWIQCADEDTKNQHYSRCFCMQQCGDIYASQVALTILDGFLNGAPPPKRTTLNLSHQWFMRHCCRNVNELSFASSITRLCMHRRGSRTGGNRCGILQRAPRNVRHRKLSRWLGWHRNFHWGRFFFLLKKHRNIWRTHWRLCSWVQEAMINRRHTPWIVTHIFEKNPNEHSGRQDKTNFQTINWNLYVFSSLCYCYWCT